MSGILTSSATGDQLQFQPAAKWIVERKFRQVANVASNIPFSILLLDRQFFLRTNACFVRHVRQINHHEAAEKLSTVNIPFAPEQEKLTVHWIRIWREGETIEQVVELGDLEVKPSKLPNRSAAHLRLQDLRSGDCLDIAYTTEKRLPEGHLA
ncbi:MAG: DUF3857 domain-containing protein, partial [Verrucomicrobiales bacterium]